MRTPFIASLLVVFVCWSGAAFAQNEEDLAAAQELDSRAQVFFGDEDFERALEMLEAAQAVAPATSRLYNMAVCHERLGHRLDALELYQEFLDSPDAPRERQERARRSIEQLQPDADDTDDPPEIFQPPPPGPSQPDRGRLSPTPFWVLLGLTGALGATTVVLGAVTLNRHDQWKAGDLADDYQSTGNALAAITDVFVGLTSATAIATIIVAIFTDWGRRDDTDARRVTLTASPGRGGGAVGLELGF